MKLNEIVWRTLIDAAILGRREWPNLAQIAFEAGAPVSTTDLALRKLLEIGAVQKFPRGGFAVISISKVITVACAARSVEKDVLTRTTRDEFDKWVQRHGVRAVSGGFDAAVHLLGGVNTVADYSQFVRYVPRGAEGINELPHGTEVAVLSMDARAERNWGEFTSLAQTLVDLFAMPGWQSAEFRVALAERFVVTREWSQHEIG